MSNGYPLILVRHAQAEHHIKGITGGWTDTELTEEGRRQSRLLAERLCRELGDLPVYLGTSNLRRARQTAEVIASQLNTAPQVHPLLIDLNNGIAAGKTHEEARQHAIPASEPIVDWQPYPQAESWRQFFTRISQFMDEFYAQRRETTLLVTHSAPVHVIIAWWLGIPVESRTHFDVDPASLTVLRVTRWGERSIERMNDTAHLYAVGIGGKIFI